jgi:hypothetical protein
MLEELTLAKQLNLFNWEWYEKQHGYKFESELNAFEHYIKKSKFSNISPSKNFDNISYIENYHDVYNSNLSPLIHYLKFGKNEGRKIFPLRPLWQHKKLEENENFTDVVPIKIAFVLHIYYSDFVEKIANILDDFNFSFDLYVTSPFDKVEKEVLTKFNNNKNINNIIFKKVPNRGRNFAPFLVEFGQDILEYDLFCHLHSKKSLHSGREQTQWLDFLLEYLICDKDLINKLINLFINNKDFGLYYPTTFWNLPTWANHWLKNDHQGKKFLAELGIEDKSNFFAYPAGGMFWAKPEALKGLLERKWTYEDFPSEPIAADGTLAHIIERIIPHIIKQNSYKQFFYYPPTGTFTEDDSYIYSAYYTAGLDRFKETIKNKKIISFDIFDTIVTRSLVEPDYAKFLTPTKAGLNIDPVKFVSLRNEAERSLRIRNNFIGDIDIYQIYNELTTLTDLGSNPRLIADLEFEIDFEMLSPKTEIINIINFLGLTKEIWFVSDMYYIEEQINKIIKAAGIVCEFKVFLSSSMKCRKDNGSMWSLIKNNLENLNQLKYFIHVGDNVCSDCQIPGDIGIDNYHLLGPIDVWLGLGFPRSLLNDFNIANPDVLKKIGPLLFHVGNNPFSITNKIL